MSQGPGSVPLKRLCAAGGEEISNEVARKARGKQTHADMGIESPHERLIPRVFDHTGSTQMIDDISEILCPVFCLSRPELGVKIRFRECRNDSGYMRGSGNVEDDNGLKGILVSRSKTKNRAILHVRPDYHPVRHTPQV